MADEAGAEIIISGIVQGVGFRPFVWRLAQRLGLSGTVANDGTQVVIHAGGAPLALDALEQALRKEAPALSRIESILRAPAAPPRETGFRIIESAAGEVSVGIVPDMATCSDCRTEMADPSARRFRYAFTNCTHCGPRFSIVTNLPYDRARTTMAGFALCPDCRAEYEDPADRRFHAQPVACPKCGPRLMFQVADAPSLEGEAALTEAVARLKAGGILAVKGIGGFHIACDARDEGTVAELRRRKHRPAKPFAVMVVDLPAARALCHVDPTEADALESPAAPVVLLRRREEARLPPSVAPGQERLGLMLAYSPLHILLLEAFGGPLVMTSANRSNAPQVYRDDAAHTELSGLVDALLTHDRPIARRLDDSVVQVVGGRQRVLRRARGLAPMPLALPEDFAGSPAILATGGGLKNALCLTLGGRALLSQHLGDLDEPASAEAFQTALADCTALFRHQPEAVACDLHPDLFPSRFAADFAERHGLPLIEVQHHHAHVAAVMAEAGWRRRDGKVLGIALDGLGHGTDGTDGTVWGGEILVCDYPSSVRRGRLNPVPLLGGDAANREPWRMLLAHLDAAGEGAAADELLAGKPLSTLRAMARKGLNAPLTSSAGRLFDAMAALAGLAPDRLSFEGEAAMALEAAAGRQESAPYPMVIEVRNGLVGEDLLEIDPGPLWRAALADRAAGAPAATLAARFHDGVAVAFAQAALRIATDEGLGTVVLCGGVFQNAHLLEGLTARLEQAGLRVLSAAAVPTNDGGLALGQTVVAAARRSA
ncbi:carbamoyltransferase HypF [Aquabacter sp. L1I39]|uniref:carbamoyltransferase HypF n=1 Tax=Aquabacter sp. L1I39 TaxID=2820278 RepID=UPI001ADB6DFE|nr:carbamoyltransferase HypF [Aquabacter sp. L1I39]QTL04646.1 carbamoyltransferase HypF [Aquabacter sp. L1I39]